MVLKPQSEFVIAKETIDFPASLQNGVVAIGNFDGVHRGHRAVLDKALSIGTSCKAPVYALTFEPHPRSFFRPDVPVFRLTPGDQKNDVLAACGLKGSLTLPFNADFASTEAEAFVEETLIERLRARHVVIGYDFHFGRGRRGTPSFLKDAGDRLGFGVTHVEPAQDEGATIISSSRIRAALAEGDLALANGLLGYRWFVDAEVQHGDKRGRDLGYPTANLRVMEACGLKYGVYAVKVSIDGVRHDGVASYGRRPTFDNGAALLEVHLFDVSKDLYGKIIRVHMISFLREELKFDGVNALIEQMNRDSDEARAAIASIEPLSDLDLSLTF
ncbi:MAG: bifunctional riboflavin kinase/FAD synthetase [Rhodobacteraceae bacterium]|nr:bifunctional riboflavin kinase/FAD synthetase [Paracoccaceae bacterium]